MPGLYLLALLVSAAGVATLDVRFRLVMPVRPVRAVAAIVIGTAFFVAWDLVGIGAGVFVRGDSPLLLGIDLAPHLPLEEPIFLAFLCYLALVLFATGTRIVRRRERREDAA